MPVGKTAEWIEAKGLIKHDQILASDYKIVKKIIDRYHRHFIDLAFESAFQFKPEKKGDSFQDTMEAYVNTYADIYFKKDKSDKDKAIIEDLSSKMRKLIVLCFKGQYSAEVKEKYSNIFKKELIKDDLLKFCDPSEKEVIEKFGDFTTYFKGFHENRANMYSDESKATAISHRIVHENLLKYLDNIRVIKRIQEQYKDFPWKDLEKNLKKIDNSLKIENLFKEEGFVHTFSQKGIDTYNLILGGQSLDTGEKIQGLNEFVNLYRQKKQLDKKQIPNLKELFKQILSDRIKFSFVPENFKSHGALLSAIRDFHREIISAKIEIDGKKLSFLKAIEKCFKDMKHYDLEKVFVSNDLGLTNISSYLFGDWSWIKSALYHYFDEQIADEKEKTKQSKKYESEKEKWSKKDYYSIRELNEAIKLYSSYIEESVGSHTLDGYFSTPSAKDENKSIFEILPNIEQAYGNLSSIFKEEYPEDKNLKSDKDTIEKIKNYMDSIKVFQNFCKPLIPKKIQDEQDLGFYNEFEMLLESLQAFNGLYNKVRNYLTGKEYSEEKFKLNFENPVLLNGWPVEKEIANSCIILRSDDLYYLGIMDKEEKRNFHKEISILKKGEETIEKMYYNQAADMSKDIQNLMVIDGKTVRKTGRKDLDGINRRLEQEKIDHLPEDINRIRKS